MIQQDKDYTVYIGLGSNEDDPATQLQRAIDTLRNTSGIEIDQCSSFYKSAPVGYSEQADFINAVCRLRTRLTPEGILAILMRIEQQQRRTRNGTQGGPRTLDLDILLYEDQAINLPALTIPHPRMHQRAFVLYPLAELDPVLRIPGKPPLDELLAACSEQRIERIK
ncbi:MAG TPA: 2-amino-4-hydroxy-6-hydroxymethyldihydropteridine diphosphokinase [Acidiferrobacteraceae bacterium]|nr:2-amino-4-hydroxy-6-hydroxymethyldihydropteridine diphosphokinase [Acidiferrobacteraceae bacterium]HEX19668.1 2-amino-4-hydroxy-6-hydroxymethyldihydropteridine diphosphokinase [Acidiferrobacteraceae bacterium]